MPYCADFETTGQTNYLKDGYVRVWLWSLVDCETKEEWYGFDIQSFFDKLEELKPKHVFFHNLKFDGSFILNYLVENKWEYGSQYTCIIDNMNTWYEIKIAFGSKVTKIWDSSKKYPGQSVQTIAELYGIEGKKEKPYFDMYREEGYIPTQEEIEYCLQDSRIIAHAIGKDWERGYRGITLSSDAFLEVKETIGGFKKWRKYMPLLSVEEDAFCRKAYKGGWVYCNPVFQNIVVRLLKIFDNNSMYPYVMYSMPLPVGKCYHRPPLEDELYIVKFTTEFKLKPNHLPTIQIKNSARFVETEYLVKVDEPVELTLTSVDYELFHKHYDVMYEENHEYYSFKKKVGLLAPYIDKWIKVKQEAVVNHQSDRKYIAKRYLNSPYGKTGMRGKRRNKIPIAVDKRLMYKEVVEETDSIYVPYACFVCAWARYITITTAQQNYDNFVYADTDSVHIIGEPHGEMDIDPIRLGAWKLEGEFELGKYLRAKTYIHGHYKQGTGNSMPTKHELEGVSRISSNDDTECSRRGKEEIGIVVDEIKCAGMPDSIKEKVEWDDFYLGAEFRPEDGYSKIQQKQVRGGCILVEMPYKIKEKLMN